MMTYDWIVIGAGITGAAAAYELAKVGFSVLLLEQDAIANNATRYSYGGLAYWAGVSDVTTQLCTEGKQRYLQLAEELGTDIEFRELNLVLTIDSNTDPQTLLANYAQFAVKPQLLTPQEAGELEPLLNQNGISGALTVKHGHMNPILTTQAYIQAMQRYNGVWAIAKVVDFIKERDRILGVKTPDTAYAAENTLVCTGGWTRQFLREAGMPVRVYHTHAELIEITGTTPQLQTLVMPANQMRFALEAAASTDELDPLWNEGDREILKPIFDPGAVQFLDGRILLGQISRTLSTTSLQSNAQASENQIRQGIRQILPSLADLPGTWHSCLVAFSGTRLPIVGSVPNLSGVHVFSGFTNPLVYAPPLAQRFAQAAAGNNDPILSQLAPQSPIPN
ncbi:FAD-binding oxidoreductase [Oscillatoria laete-virens NRMC-F 0139]|nr:FAD-binding oxidoreductase [Oscillatoria laete-virens NRMC-F 0139]